MIKGLILCYYNKKEKKIDKYEQMFYSIQNRTFVPCKKGDYIHGKK